MVIWKNIKSIFKKITFGIRRKIIFCFLGAMIILMFLMSKYTYAMLNSIVALFNERDALCINNLLSDYFDAYDVESFHEMGLMDEHYEENLNMINHLADSMDVEFIYVMVPNEKNAALMYASGTDYETILKYYKGKEIKDEDGNYLGFATGEYSNEEEKECILNNTQSIIYSEGDLSDAEKKDPYMRLTKQAVEFAFPIYDANGQRVATVLIQDSYDEAKENTLEYSAIILFGAIVFLTIFTIVMLLIVSGLFIVPVRRMAQTAMQLVHSVEKEDSDVLLHDFADMKYRENNTETDNLRAAFLSLEKSINSYTTDIKSMAAEKERLNTELNLASSIQQSYLPKTFPQSDNYMIYATSVPAKEVGGDFYDYCLIDENHLAIAMADVSGKGMPAALFMMTAKTLLSTHLRHLTSPGKILYEVNNILCENNSETLFVTVWLGIIDLTTGVVTVSNAGHENPVIVKNGVATHFEHDPGFVLGGIEMMDYEDFTIQLEKGDTLLLYTDGLTDATNGADEMYGIDNLTKCMENAANRAKDAKECTELVYSDIHAFTGDNSQFDDMTMMTFIMK